MTEESKLLLDEIRGAMSRMPNDPDGLAGWLLSNFYLEKINPEKEIEPTDFPSPKQKRPRQGQLTKAQKFYQDQFEAMDGESENDNFDSSESPFMQAAAKKTGFKAKSSAEAAALLKKAKQPQEWDPAVLAQAFSDLPETDNEAEDIVQKALQRRGMAGYQSDEEEDFDLPELPQNPKVPQTLQDVQREMQLKRRAKQANFKNGLGAIRRSE